MLRLRQTFYIIFLMMLMVGWGSSSYAMSITFGLGFGGTVGYGGGSSPFTTIDGVVNQVGNGIDLPISITGGDLDFETGAFSGSVPMLGGTFTDFFNGDGSLTITGDIGSGNTTLLHGSFSSPPTFFCCAGSTASFNGVLNIDLIDSTLATSLGFSLPASGGSIAQTEIILNASLVEEGGPFTGTQAGGAITVTPVPEPVSLLLIGSGFLGLAAMKRKIMS